jgi:F420-non-reducing hydrogenase iron-sulfur subunit
MRIQYAHNIRIIEVPCSGVISQQMILQTFEYGADGVMVAGCMEGGCHFLQGNCRAKKRIGDMKKLLDTVGVGGERLEMYEISSSMGQRFGEMADEVTERIRRLGPNPILAAK